VSRQISPEVVISRQEKGITDTAGDIQAARDDVKANLF